MYDNHTVKASKIINHMSSTHLYKQTKCMHLIICKYLFNFNIKFSNHQSTFLQNFPCNRSLQYYGTIQNISFMNQKNKNPPYSWKNSKEIVNQTFILLGLPHSQCLFRKDRLLIYTRQHILTKVLKATCTLLNWLVTFFSITSNKDNN